MERYYGQKPEMAWVDINKLDVDNAYQRNTNGCRSKENIKKIMNNFCWEEFTPITVVKTEKGTYNIIDGQHRYKAADDFLERNTLYQKGVEGLLK